MPGFPRACLLAEFLPRPLLPRLSPIDNTATEIFLHVYGSCICKISMSTLLLPLRPSSFVALHPHPSCNAHSLIPVGMCVYIDVCVCARVVKTVRLFFIFSSGEVEGPVYVEFLP